ncbi:putative oxidoreductase [Gordonia araii NBRC 100433]|uniref:Cholesterol oxidase n=1 Tax=Gordonia araii NBRC 100433 TaxID=1073574 RepID=G7GZT2_9ACTN|nr:GMC family oxidoreductase [Gordonia araii]NNG98778.1 GMC family oxidoreductase [Gordonia araii NBRC 100433]GAB09107.1 putative oxidoreductase [Gordonia araii NBRC 100433]
MSRSPQDSHFDVLIIGSGFGGSVSALRLTEKGYRVGVLEAGRRFTDDQFAKTSWRLRKFVWAPKLGLLGVQRIHLLKDVMILAGAGVGGGSLNYANTLYKPPSPFFNDKQWAHITDWESELSPHYDQASRMLGVVKNPTFTNSDRVMKEVAEEMGVGETFVATPVGVFFGEKTGGEGSPGQTVPDPYFGGAGPERTACTECGACMTGCRVGAKNTLVKNYLGLAESAGAQVVERTTVDGLRQLPDGTWEVSTHGSSSWGPFGRRRRIFTADNVVMAAGTFNTQKLMHAAKLSTLPKISDAMGVLTRTNSESILGAMSTKIDPENDYSQGVAITSSFHPDESTHIEPVRYGKGSNAMAYLQTVLTDGGSRLNRIGQALKQFLLHPTWLPRLLVPRGWSQKTVIALVMQSSDNSLTTFVRKRGPFKYVTSRQGHGEPNPTWIPAGNEATRRIADKLDGGIAGGTWGDIFNIPLTAHYLGGCVISDDPSSGVIDPYHRVWNYPSLYVVDGASITANLGVNPSLSISAQAERAASLWPNKGEADQRPAQGLPYARIAPVAPVSPVVPEGAPGALRLPITPVRAKQKEKAAG